MDSLPVLAAVATIELGEVITVVGHDRPLGRLRVAEQVVVREAAKFSTFADGFDIAASAAKLLGD